jgi:hypothetical protein
MDHSECLPTLLNPLDEKVLYPRRGSDLRSQNRADPWTISHARVVFKDPRRKILEAYDKDRSFEEARQAKLMLVKGSETLKTQFSKLRTKTDKMERIRLLMRIVQVFEEEWQLPLPPMVISVTGNALPFEMRPAFHDSFCQSLVKATESTNAWVISGGTSTGVMKLVGEALGQTGNPVIGIASWGVIVGRGTLVRPDVATLARRSLGRCHAEPRPGPAGAVKRP